MNEIEILTKRIAELEFQINLMTRPGVFQFQKDVAFLADRRIGFYGNLPISQPSSTGTVGTMSGTTGTTVGEASTFIGGIGTTAYTIGDIVTHLKNLGLIKS